jgi:5-methyltetrahydrofolate--homocysteine methyltransferase
MKVGLPILKSELAKRGGSVKYLGRAVIGTVEGDIHDIGKSIVAALWEVAGLEVIDLGVDVPPQKFVEAIKQYNPDIVGMSALMTTTMAKQRETIEAIKQAGLRDRVKIVVGGAPTTEEWAKEIGADGRAPDAISAINLVKRLLGVKE